MNPLKSLRSTLVVFVAVLLLIPALPAVQAAAQGNFLPGQFAYVDGGARLVLVRGNVEEPVLLVQAGMGESIYHPHFSSDGRHLAFCLTSSMDGDVPDLLYLDTLTLEKIKVTPDGSCSHDWSPDGQTLIFSTHSSMDFPSAQANGIWAYSLQTRESKLLIPSDIAVTDPRWSPDGRTISYFDFCFECVGQFHTYDLETGAEEAWSHQGTDDYIGPDVDWSPDGKSLVYDKELWMYASGGETYGLYRAGSDGANRQEIYSQPGKGAYFPLWSPDGKRIVFASFESFVIGNYMNVRGDLMTVSADGSDVNKLYSSLYEIYPQAWSPDGRYLLFVEPTSMTQDAVQEQQLILLDVETGNPLWKQPSSGSMTADWAPIPVTEETSSKVTPQFAGKPGMLFVSRDDAMAFYEPISGQVQKLTPSFSGEDFSVSPDGRTVLFGDQIVSVQSQADGSVKPSITAADHPNDFSLLTWSPDGQIYGFVENGIIWQADHSGNRTKLGEGSAPPDWSFDGRWMAFCDRQGRLWIAEAGKPADWIVQQESCQVRWSPSQSILAYVTFPAHDLMDWASGTAFLYDPLSGSTKEVGQKVSEVGWSPDGKLVSLQRIGWMGISNYGFSVSAVNPESGQELLIEEFDAEAAGNHGWIDQSDGYIVGKYKFQADLLNKEQLADILFDATRDGNSLLVGSESDQSVQVGCQDAETNAYYPIADITLKNRPGIYASFSPDGTHILVSNDEVEKTTDWIAGCGGATPQQFETLALPYQQYFSTGGSWLVMEQTDAFGEQNAKIVLRELKSGHVQEVPAGLQTSSTWFQMPEAPVLPSAAASLDVAAAASPVPGSTVYPAPMQDGTADNRMVMLSLLLWAGALIAIVVLMLHLWRSWSIPSRPAKPLSAEPVVEENIVPTVEIVSEPSHEELEKDFQNGVELVRAGKAGEGITALTRVIRFEPENNIAWFWLGIASARQKEYRSAEPCFLQAKRYGHPEADKALEWLRKQTE